MSNRAALSVPYCCKFPVTCDYLIPQFNRFALNRENIKSPRNQNFIIFSLSLHFTEKPLAIFSDNNTWHFNRYIRYRDICKLNINCICVIYCLQTLRKYFFDIVKVCPSILLFSSHQLIHPPCTKSYLSSYKHIQCVLYITWHWRFTY